MPILINDVQQRAIDTGWGSLVAAWADTDRQAWRKIVNTKPVRLDTALDDPAVAEAIPQQTLLMWLAETNIGFAGALLIAGFVPIDGLYEGRESEGPLQSARIALDAIEGMGLAVAFPEWYATQRRKLDGLEAANQAAGGATPVADQYVDTYPDPHHWLLTRIDTPGVYGMMFANQHLANTFARDMMRESEALRYWPQRNRLHNKNVDAQFLLFTWGDAIRMRGCRFDAMWADDRTSPEIVREMIMSIRRG